MSLSHDISKICESSKFNGNVIISKQDQVLFEDGFGYADIASKKTFNRDSIFRIGSISKQITAVCVLQLMEQGLLRLDDPINKHVKNAIFEHPITIHHLLSNSSGIPNFDVFGDYDHIMSKKDFYQAMVNEIILGKPLNFKPGERFEYASSGFVLLTHLIELLSNQSYDQYVQTHIFDILGMHHSGFHFMDTNRPTFVTLYDMKDQQIEMAQPYDMRKAGGAGGLYASAYDLYLWGKGLMSGQLISKPTLDLMLSIQTPIQKDAGYGYGVVVSSFTSGQDKHNVMHHPGNGPGVFAQNMIIDQETQIILLSNINDRQTFLPCFQGIEQYIIDTWYTDESSKT